MGLYNFRVKTELNEAVSYSFEFSSYQMNYQSSLIKKAKIPLQQKRRREGRCLGATNQTRQHSQTINQTRQQGSLN